MYQLLKITESKNPETWWESVCVSECPALGQTSKCIKNGGATTGCPKAELFGNYGTHLV